MSSTNADYKNNSLAKKLIIFGIILIISAVGIFTLTFYPVLKEELIYQINKNKVRMVAPTNEDASVPENAELIEPVNKDFSIVIPKISANAPIIANVDPNDSKIYQRKLTQGVAHATGTTLPGQAGNTFLFAHSAGNFYEANRFNAVFYLINKLEFGDEIDIFHKDELIKYSVTNKVIVKPEVVEYIQGTSNADILTLMTCWPPGTTLNRLIITAEASDSEE